MIKKVLAGIVVIVLQAFAFYGFVLYTDAETFAGLHGVPSYIRTQGALIVTMELILSIQLLCSWLTSTKLKICVNVVGFVASLSGYIARVYFGNNASLPNEDILNSVLFSPLFLLPLFSALLVMWHGMNYVVNRNVIKSRNE